MNPYENLYNALVKEAKKHEPENDDLFYGNDALMDDPAFKLHGKIRSFFGGRKSKQHNKVRQELISKIRKGKRKEVLQRTGHNIDPNEPLLQHPALQDIDLYDTPYAAIGYTAAYNNLRSANNPNETQTDKLLNAGTNLGNVIALNKYQKQVDEHNLRASTLRHHLAGGQRDKVLKMLDKETNRRTGGRSSLEKLI